VVDARITFEVNPEGSATGLVLHQGGRDIPGPRIDSADAKRIEEWAPKEHREVSVDPKQLDRVVGRYQLGPDFILTISREGNHLFSQATGQPKAEIFPDSDWDYFFKAVYAQITFQTDDHGSTIGLILHQGGLDTPAPRID
jgi:D-alanyl-D-alanine carboxypeptidase